MFECVPNFSEGEDESLIREIVSAVRAGKVLDVHSDPDHNRSVVTIVGEGPEIRRAAFELTERALQLLDVREHYGAHPFIGVMDVVPFVPLEGSDMENAIELAYELGDELWDRLRLPVYFYGEAAIIPKRKELPYVRRGGYKTLREESGAPHRLPDLGHGLHPTGGAVAVGARNFLIAFNVDLATSDLDLAKSIAKRHPRDKRRAAGGKGARGRT